MKYIIEKDKTYSEIDLNLKNKAKSEKLPIICLSGNTSNYPNDFKYVIYDDNNNMKALFIDINDAKEYSIYLKK
jgi:hypothetical protein